MYSTQQAYYPPITTNTLDASQRARLMRSTRKLGAILGTTPRLADPEPIPISFEHVGRSSMSSCSSDGHDDYAPKHTFASSYKPSMHKKDASFYSSSSLNPSTTSIELPLPQSSTGVLPMPKSFSSRPRRSREAPRPLVLRFNTVSVDADDVRVCAPASPPFTARPLPAAEVLSPVTPSAPSEAEIRRKRIAKLNRTFGENVPPEMVLSSVTSTRSNEKPLPQLPQPQRDEVCITPPPRRSSRVWVTGSNAGKWTGEWNRRDITQVQQELRMLRAR
ncbi:hypothetical protein EIP86_002164 [Pleurotus ostreatoroseus]|nr:hypothetical protein EIP86_002164 [Pleurotus ostreatoroseus]